VLFSIIMILTCSLVFFFIGIEFAGDLVSYQANALTWENLTSYAKCLYFSVVTFTTLGYGDFIPLGMARVVSAIEAFTGSFTIALFVVVFVRKMTR